MKILFVNPYYPPWAPGGAEHSLEQMCMRLSERGWIVEVLATVFDERVLDERRHNYWIRWVRAPFHIRPGQDINAEDYFRTTHFRNSMLKRFHELDLPDVIIANNAQAYGVVGILGRQLRVPTIGLVRDTQMLCEYGECMDNHSARFAIPCDGFLGASFCSIKFQRVRGVIGWRPLPAWFWSGLRMHMRRKKLRSIVRQFDHIVTISDALNMLVRNTLPQLTPENISTIRNFSTQVKPTDKQEVMQFLNVHGLIAKKYFLFAGRKTYGKGADLLVEATAMVRNTHPECQTLLLGRGTASKTAGSGCIDVDSVSQSLLLGLLGQAAGLVIPGRWQEGLHRTMIDAIFAGVPVICSEAGAPPIDGVVNGLTGDVVPCGNSEALASAMIRILGWTSVQRENCKKESRRQFEKKFETKLLLLKWNEVLSAVVEKRRAKEE